MLPSRTAYTSAGNDDICATAQPPARSLLRWPSASKSLYRHYDDDIRYYFLSPPAPADWRYRSSKYVPASYRYFSPVALFIYLFHLIILFNIIFIYDISLNRAWRFDAARRKYQELLWAPMLRVKWHRSIFFSIGADYWHIISCLRRHIYIGPPEDMNAIWL